MARSDGDFVSVSTTHVGLAVLTAASAATPAMFLEPPRFARQAPAHSLATPLGPIAMAI